MASCLYKHNKNHATGKDLSLNILEYYKKEKKYVQVHFVYIRIKVNV